ncbi:hypothetical protein RHSIM_Rhsim11G0140500 [Rhododendron simsii]|uniref:Protein kinase domain-containing protein n=1 Tax=Rhododendron simsii TaxID=118357 RepID=A0A834G765_RHOSS|nr:hypothetical protein RHSIM_Rhsim11G0140500 [Rhododendron simsii]
MELGCSTNVCAVIEAAMLWIAAVAVPMPSELLNILLDDDYNAYLSDSGLARLLDMNATIGVAGTFGYIAPEYAMTCCVSNKVYVYSYGVVLLELISDKKVLDPSFFTFGNGFNIVGWGSMVIRQGHAKEFFTAGWLALSNIANVTEMYPRAAAVLRYC